MKTNLNSIATAPILFERNRVFRVYRGGKLFHDFFGDAAEDGNTPEEWVASAVHALNEGSTDPHEGISRVRGTDIYLNELIEKCKPQVLGEHNSLDVLVKLLDSAIRLPMQAHPDRDFSIRHFNSTYGKAEMWVVLATREDACIYFGFREQIDSARFAAAIAESETDKDVMEHLANRVPVKPGDVFFIPAKMIHAIGAGCLILEVQEPTDFTIQPERWCGDYRLSDTQMYLGISKEDALDCFDYSRFGPETVRRGRKAPRLITETDTLRAEQLVGIEDTPCFSANRYRLSSGCCTLEVAPAVHVVTEGVGRLTDGTDIIPLTRGDYFLLPAAAVGWRMESDNSLEWIECLPPANNQRKEKTL